MTAGAASVDPTHSCPPGSNNAPYDLHATVSLHNPTSSAVTIKSVSAELTLESTGGSWAEKVGDNYTSSAAKFTPATVGAGATTTLDVTIPSACTNGSPGTGGKSYGDYRVTLHIQTSGGTLTATSEKPHRIVAA